MKKRLRIALLTALLALAAWCGWYARPVGVETLFPGLKPDMAYVWLMQFDGGGHESRSLMLSAGTPEFDAFWSQVQSLRFHRSPLNPLLQTLPFLDFSLRSAKTVQEGDMQEMFIGFTQDNGQAVWRSEHLSFFVDAWQYEDFAHHVSLPLLMKNGSNTGQALAQTLWEQAKSESYS